MKWWGLVRAAMIGGNLQASPTDVTLPPGELAEVDRRLDDFYRVPMDPSVMSRPVPKYRVASGLPVAPNPLLRLPGPPPAELLLQTAQAKATSAFRRAACADWQRHFPRSPCRQAEAASEADDAVEDLTDHWLPSADVVHDLTSLPQAGAVSVMPWSDDYWRMQWGGTSYRYADGVQYTTYAEAVSAYQQPQDWLRVSALPAAEAEPLLRGWSPAEKYDLSVGDTAFGLTTEQKREGLAQLDAKGNVPYWMGICDGNASASIMVPRADIGVDAAGPAGLTVHWYPSDIRALASLLWARGEFSSNMIGGRCEEAHPKLYANGRIKSQSCFDTNPATFHLALGNLIGKAKRPFIMDASFDAEVWNEPLISYQVVYFNPLDHAKRSADWRDVAVPYDADFKAADRFQDPLTRGTRKGGRYDDGQIKKIVGVIATVVYVDDVAPVASDDPPGNPTDRDTYTYDLELAEVDGHLLPLGGEWHENTHPDFLWVPRPGTVAMDPRDAAAPPYDPQVPASGDVTAAARRLDDGAPLCRVVAGLVSASSGHAYPACGP